MAIDAKTRGTIRSGAGGYLTDTCEIVEPILEDDGAGSVTTAWRVVASDVPCTFRALSGREIVTAEQLKQRGDYRLKVRVTREILDTYRVRVLSNTYAVVWAPPVAALSLYRIVGLEECEAVETGETFTTTPGMWIGIGRIPTYAEAI